MSASLYLSRARLRAGRGEALASIAPILLPEDGSRRAGHAHRLVWMLFQEITDVRRDFLWRDEGRGNFMVLSHRPPTDPHGLFDLDTTPFEPRLAAGDRLRFALRANPTTTTKRAGTKVGTNGSGEQVTRGKRVDVVMDALRHVPETDWDARTGRAFERDRLVRETATTWLAAQGARCGFSLGDEEPIRAESYVQVAVERTRGRRPAGISMIDLSGRLTVTDPAAFLDKLAHGFGSAKAFGCGLMMIRRTR